MSFLPEGYEKPRANSKYLKFVEGDNKFRILSDAITGYLDWDDKKPLRTKIYPERLIDRTKPAKHFWAFVVWDYATKEIKILEITQSGIQNAIYDLHSDANWGDPKGFDLNIKRKGKSMDTEYSVIPTPPMPVHPEIKKLYEDLKCDLNALYDGLDPFITSNTENAYNSIVEPNNTYPDTSEVSVNDLPF